MDALIYTIMSGAERTLRAQQVRANNIANAETNGFRADIELASSQPVAGYGYDARHMARQQAGSVASHSGTLIATGRELDVAIQGDGYFAVADGDGEAYTRAGSLSLDADGTLKVNGRALLGDGGAIVLPPHQQLTVAADGSLSILRPGDSSAAVVDRLKLVKPAPQAVSKNAAGLIVSRSGQTLAADDSVRVLAGHLERSNVSAVEEMIATMSLSRGFEMQMKMYHAADDMVEAGNRLVRG